MNPIRIGIDLVHPLVGLRHQLRVDSSQVVEHFDVAWEKFCRSLQYRKRLLVSAQFTVTEAQIEVGPRFFRVQGNCFFQGLQRFLVLIGANVSHSQEKIGAKDLGSQFERAREGLDGLVIFPLEVIHESKIRVDLGELRPEFEDGLVFGRRRSVITRFLRLLGRLEVFPDLVVTRGSRVLAAASRPSERPMSAPRRTRG